MHPTRWLAWPLILFACTSGPTERELQARRLAEAALEAGNCLVVDSLLNAVRAPATLLADLQRMARACGLMTVGWSVQRFQNVWSLAEAYGDTLRRRHSDRPVPAWLEGLRRRVLDSIWNSMEAELAVRAWACSDSAAPPYPPPPALPDSTPRIWDDTRRPDGRYPPELRTRSLADARFLLCTGVDTARSDGSCGPYRYEGVLGAPVYLKRLRVRYRLRLKELRSAAVVAETTMWSGSPPGCPLKTIGGDQIGRLDSLATQRWMRASARSVSALEPRP